MDQLGDKTCKYGGSIREAGGTLASMAAAKENEYFRRLDQQKLEEIRKSKEQEAKKENTNEEAKDRNK
jgi:hypothetical protein